MKTSEKIHFRKPKNPDEKWVNRLTKNNIPNFFATQGDWVRKGFDGEVYRELLIPPTGKIPPRHFPLIKAIGYSTNTVLVSDITCLSLGTAESIIILGPSKKHVEIAHHLLHVILTGLNLLKTRTREEKRVYNQRSRFKHGSKSNTTDARVYSSIRELVYIEKITTSLLLFTTKDRSQAMDKFRAKILFTIKLNIIESAKRKDNKMPTLFSYKMPKKRFITRRVFNP